jgi:tRNA(Ile)-lysidine synthase
MNLEALDLRLERAVERPVALALSGGSDSTALLLLAVRWARANGRRLLALTVDHGLNLESARWTAEAGELARRLGVDWRSLAWTGPKPATGLPAAARQARHALLAEAARMAGARVVLMGHTADDVAESALIRRDTPSHGRLEAWAPSPVWPEGRGLFLLRPLLAARRDELRALLTAEGLGWLEDPANADPRFARSRARAALAGGEGAPPSVQATSALISDAFQADEAGRVRLPRTAAPELIAKALLCASGRERPPAGEAVRRVAARLQAGERFRATLGGARLLAEGDELAVVRDAGERARGGLQPVPARLGEAVVFDGRFEVEVADEGLQVMALSGLAGRLSPADAARLKAVPVEARPALPALVDAAGQVSLPELFGGGPGGATALGPRRLAAACGLIVNEAEAARGAIFWARA